MSEAKNASQLAGEILNCTRNLNYAEDRYVDKYSLDSEWERQPQLAADWNTAWAQAVFERDKAKEQLEIKKAEVGNDIRENPERYGFAKKPNEDTIKDLVQTNSEVVKANRKLVDAVYNMNLILSGKIGMDHRKSALERLVMLENSGYFSKPNVTQSEREKFKERTEGEDKQATKAHEDSLDGSLKQRRKKRSKE
jgi:hypothetical protein